MSPDGTRWQVRDDHQFNCSWLLCVDASYTQRVCVHRHNGADRRGFVRFAVPQTGQVCSRHCVRGEHVESVRLVFYCGRAVRQWTNLQHSRSLHCAVQLQPLRDAQCWWWMQSGVRYISLRGRCVQHAERCRMCANSHCGIKRQLRDVCTSSRHVYFTHCVQHDKSMRRQQRRGVVLGELRQGCEPLRSWSAVCGHGT